jgi:lipopolysaccharide export LptBFGC system permease protein LptF
MKHDQEVWQSEGRKKIAADKELDMQRLQEEELFESRLKSEQKRTAQEIRRAADKAMKHEQEVWQSEGRKKIAVDKADDLQRLEAQDIEAYKVKNDAMRVAKAHQAAVAKAVTLERNAHYIEGKRERAAYQKELERKAYEAEHTASFAGLMNPFAWGDTGGGGYSAYS